MKNLPDRLNGNWLLVKPLPKEEEMLGSLIIPETANANLSEAVVQMRSEQIKEAVTPGEKVCYPSKAGLGQIISGEAYLWLEIGQVWAITAKKEDKKDGL